MSMPIYEYVCAGCGKSFEALVYGEKKAECPGCSGTELEQKFSSYAVRSSSGATAAAPRAAGSCGSCGDPRGPGACSLD